MGEHLASRYASVCEVYVEASWQSVEADLTTESWTRSKKLNTESLISLAACLPTFDLASVTVTTVDVELNGRSAEENENCLC